MIPTALKIQVLVELAFHLDRVLSHCAQKRNPKVRVRPRKMPIRFIHW
jgi:hypothetical protein